MPRITLPPFTRGADASHPVLGDGNGPSAYRSLGGPGGLSQFGARIEVLPPGARSGHSHWHEAADEMVYVLAGEVVLIEDAETTLRPGEAACWPAGNRPGGRRSSASAKRSRRPSWWKSSCAVATRTPP